MKNVIKRALSLCMVLALVMMAVPVDVVKAAYASTPGNISVTSVTDGNKFVGYKVMDITYDSGTNAVTYEWVDEVAAAIKVANGGTALTVEEFYAKDGEGNYIYDEEARQRLLAGVPEALTSGPELAEQTAASNTVSWSNVPLGGYLIVPTLTTDVYQIMLLLVQPEFDDDADEYKTKDGTKAAKKTQLNITKGVNDTTTGAAQIIQYTVEVDVPTYESGAIDKTFIMGDKLQTGLTFDNTSLKVYSYDGSVYAQIGTMTPTVPGTYTVTEGSDLDANYTAQTFVINFDYDSISSYKKIKVEYDVRLADAATEGTYDNNAVIKYSNYPFTDGSFAYDTATTEVTTYEILVEKTNTGGSDKLTGAEFDVYLEIPVSLADSDIDTTEFATTVSGGSTGDVKALPAGNYIKVGSLSPTGDAGYYSIDKVDAGNYYIVETKAPVGYQLPAEAIPLVVTSGDENPATPLVIDKTITNSSGFTLPETGGTGTVIFTVVGVSLMCVAVLALFVLRKKEASKN